MVGFRLGQQAGGDGKASSHLTGKFSSLSPNHLGAKVAITEAEEQSSMEKRMGGAAFRHLTTAALGSTERKRVPWVCPRWGGRPAGGMGSRWRALFRQLRLEKEGEAKR